MGPSHHGIRRLLAALRRPEMLERLPLAVQLKVALGAATAREAVIKVVDRAFSVPTPSNELMRSVVVSGDVEGNKASYVASTLHLSMRTLFRRRSDAVEAIAAAIDRIVHHSSTGSYLPE